jgi:hypothetical protein
MGIMMDQVDDLDAMRAMDAKRNANTRTADDMRSAALNRLRQHSPAPRTTDFLHTTSQASPKMIGYVMVLLRQLGELNPTVADTARAWWMERAIVDKDTNRVIGSQLSGNKVSDVINRLKAQLDDARKAAQTAAVDAPAPVAPVTTPARTYDAYDDITDGNYAITDADGKNWFYRITRKAGKGQYQGRTFINVQMRVSDDLIKVYGGWAVKRAILEKIRAAGVDQAHLAYATLMGKCWHCHADLTDNTGNPYFNLGLGPICGGKV